MNVRNLMWPLVKCGLADCQRVKGRITVRDKGWG